MYEEGQPVAWTMALAVAVADLDASAQAVREAGGEVTMGPMDVFDMGRYAVVTDPGGAVFSLWQARTFSGMARINEPGALCWVELVTRDTAAAEAFYRSVFGWSARGRDMDGWVYTMFAKDGQDFGGMMAMDERFPPGLPPHWMLYFAVDSVDAAVARATELGGTVVMPAMDIPETGRFSLLRDPQDGAFAVFTPAM